MRTVVLQTVVSGSLWIVGVIHLLPFSGVAGAGRLKALYGLDFADPTSLLLMRHRAVLFGLLGLFLVAAALRPPLRTAAFCLGLGSVASFLALAALGGPFTEAITKVVAVDGFALVCLLAGAVAHARTRASAGR